MFSANKKTIFDVGLSFPGTIILPMYCFGVLFPSSDMSLGAFEMFTRSRSGSCWVFPMQTDARVAPACKISLIAYLETLAISFSAHHDKVIG